MIGPITDVVSIYKQQRTGNKESYSSTPSFVNVNATISPTGEHIQTSEGGIYSYQLFEIFIYDTTVVLNNGDKVVSGGTNYLITGSPNLYNNRYVQAISAMAKVVM